MDLHFSISSSLCDYDFRARSSARVKQCSVESRDATMIFTGAEQWSSFWNGLILLLLLQTTTNITWHYQNFSMSLKLSLYSVFGRVSNLFIFFFFGWVHQGALYSPTEKQNQKSGTIKKEKTNKQKHFRNIRIFRISNMFMLATSVVHF